MKRTLLLLPVLLILSSCSQTYENEYGIEYTDPDSVLPEELKLSSDELKGTFFSSNNGPEEELCLDESQPIIVPLFQSNLPFLSEVKRSAYICGDQYVIYDFEYESAFYGLFNLEDHFIIKKDLPNE